MTIIKDKTIAKNIKKYRKRLKLTQDLLARKADIPYNTLIKIETAYTDNPSIQTLIKIAAALKVTVNNLIEGRKG